MQFTIPLHSNSPQKLPLIFCDSLCQHLMMEKGLYMGDHLLSQINGQCLWNCNLCVTNGASWHGPYQISGQSYILGSTHQWLQLNHCLAYSINHSVNQECCPWLFTFFMVMVTVKATTYKSGLTRLRGPQIRQRLAGDPKRKGWGPHATKWYI